MKSAAIQICCLLLLFSAPALASLQINGNGTVTDSETGLIWQQEATGTAKTWQEALAYCAALNFDGNEDWRLPNRNELQSIVDYQEADPAIDSTAFPDTTGTFWTSTTSAGSGTSAYTVDFSSGAISSADKDANTYKVLAVRNGGTATPQERIFYDNGNGTVTDSRNGLMWLKAPLDVDNDGIADIMTWQEALAQVASIDFPLLRYYDWRLPDRNELQSIADYRWYGPAIDTNIFPQVIGGKFWTSTTSAGSGASAYTVDFTSGAVSSSDKDSNQHYVLVVRGEQTPVTGFFKFFGIPNQVKTNTLFPVEVVAENSDFSGKVDLNIEDGGGVIPSSVELVNGRWTGDIAVTRPEKTRLTGVSNTRIPFSGRSDWFEVEHDPTGNASADVEVSIVESQVMFTEGDYLSYTVYVRNLGYDTAPDVTIDLQLSEGFEENSSFRCKGNDESVCQEISDNLGIARFKAMLFPGQFIKIYVSGGTKNGFNEVSLRVQAHDTAVNDPKEDNNDVESLLRTEIPDLEGSQDAYLWSLPESSDTPRNADTVVLTHGLQPTPCFSFDLWTGSDSDPAQAGYLIQQSAKAKGLDLNIYQFFWEGACQGGKIPTQKSYKRARQNVYFAAQQLAKQLYDELGPNYDKRIHFIGHSLGTAVNAYAADIFLKKALNVTEAQVTILDHPNRISKILGFSNSEVEGPDIDNLNFDEIFFAKVLPFNRSGLNLYVDNYHADIKDTTKVGSAGVGTDITGDVFNRELSDPHEVGDKILEHEGVDNDHSGVQQWYRWTIRPNDGENFQGSSVCPESNDYKWNDLPSGINESLNPCPEKRGGWRESILLNDPVDFPESNDGSTGDDPPDTTSTEVETSGSSPYGCSASSGNFVATVCQEQPSVSPAAEIAAAAASQVYSLEEEPEIPKSSIEFQVTVPEFLRYMSFDYSFSNIGDGDYVYIFLDGVIAWKMSGDALTAGETVSSGPVPIRAESGQKKLIIALYGVGEQNAQFSLDNFKFTTVADTDNDGVADDDDAFPNDSAEWQDTDNDGTGDNADTDDDGDGISDSIEQAGCSDPLNPDTDHDTIPDGTEDTDRDGTVDPGETNPCLQDTDSDNTLDNVDGCPADPNKTAPGVCGCGVAETDHDTDGVPDCTDADDDNDGLSDILEAQGCTDALDADTDDDGIPDGAEDEDHNGVVGDAETDPCDMDSDDDGIQDGTEQGYTIADVGPDTDLLIFQPDSDPASTTDALNVDSDGDGIADGVEDSNHNGRVDAGETDPGRQGSVPLSAILLLLLR